MGLAFLFRVRRSRRPLSPSAARRAGAGPPLYLYGGRSHRQGVPAPAVAILAVAFSIGAAGEGRERPLPDPEVFKREVRARLRPDRELLSAYTYIEKREEIKVSATGRVTEGPVKVYEVYPSPEGGVYKRLVAVNGVPLSKEELAKADRKHREDLARELERRRRETPGERARRLKERAEKERERNAMLDEIFEAYDIRMVGRESVEGHSTIVVTLDPRPNHRPRTEEGELMLKLRAKAWVSETDYELVRAEAEVIDDVTVGWGIIGRLHTGTRATYERRRINEEVWLPAREVIEASGRALLFRTFKVNTVTEWYGYRRRNENVNSQLPRPNSQGNSQPPTPNSQGAGAGSPF